MKIIHKNGNFFRAEVGKKVKILIFIPNHHFWMSGGLAKQGIKNIRLNSAEPSPKPGTTPELIPVSNSDYHSP
jgi:hypothetical protein